MSTNLNDTDLLHEILKDAQFLKKLEEEISVYIGNKQIPNNISYPLDKETITKLSKFKELAENEKAKKNIPYSQVGELDKFWTLIITKSIKCLRLFDTRYPFKKNPEKTIVAYDIDKLTEVYKKYTEFEGLLYGSNVNYRDHRLHIFRTWLIGLYVIISLKFPIDDLDGTEKCWENYGKLTYCEKISMWTIIAFCHDLGYPWEKSKGILPFIQDMMKETVADFQITADFSFSGIQKWNIKDIISFISTQMIYLEEEESKKYYKGRKQPKYHFKFIKSLEEYKHGIIGAILLFKLQYFIESDFNLEHDYKYKAEDARQFYIRREILRAITSHTCFDIYNIKVTTFSSLLYLCDELQNWGRKNWHELYSAKDFNPLKITIDKFTKTEIIYTEEIDLRPDKNLSGLVEEYYFERYYKYKQKFRDGEDSQQRKFDIKNTIKARKDIAGLDKPEVVITISILGNNKNDSFEVSYKNCEDDDKLNKNDIKGSLFENEFIEL
jgi:hypothetical protein